MDAEGRRNAATVLFTGLILLTDALSFLVTVL